MENPIPNDSTELADNRISLYSAQWGKCHITGEELYIGEMEIHHKLPKESGGTDKYQNLVWVTDKIHELIHATREPTIRKYLRQVKLDSEQLDKLNKLRIQAGNCVIEQ
jgi:5-methylcytosine-specific restriction endonuclease McrA